MKSFALASKVKSLALASKPQVLENCPVLGSRTALFFKQLKFRLKAPETSGKICDHFFCFPHLEHRRSQGEDGRGSAPFPIEISPMTKMRQKILKFLQFQFLFSIFRLQQYNYSNNIEGQGRRVPLNSIFASQFKRIT